METLDYYTVILDGIDKCGKDTIAKYVWELDRRLNVFCRGWPSLVVYAKKYSRDCKYSLPYKNALYVHLTVDKADWQIRCNLHNEPTINYYDDSNLFEQAFEFLQNTNYKIVKYNTSDMTAYQIAEQIVKTIHNLNKGVVNNGRN